MTPLDASRSIARPIGKFGSRFMLDPEVYAAAAGHGYAELDFYCTGRGGALGEVAAPVVVAAFGFFDPAMVTAMWDLGRTVGPVQQAATLFGEACADWGRRHFGDGVDYRRLSELSARVIEAAPIEGLTLFAAWRDQPVPADDRGAAAHRLNLLREFRGGCHIMSVACAGVTPVEAVMASGGVDNAALMGFSGPLPDIDALAGTMAGAEETTTRLASAPLAVLTEDELEEFVALVHAAFDGLV